MLSTRGILWASLLAMTWSPLVLCIGCVHHERGGGAATTQFVPLLGSEILQLTLDSVKVDRSGDVEISATLTNISNDTLLVDLEAAERWLPRMMRISGGGGPQAYFLRACPFDGYVDFFDKPVHLGAGESQLMVSSFEVVTDGVCKPLKYGLWEYFPDAIGVRQPRVVGLTELPKGVYYADVTVPVCVHGRRAARASPASSTQRVEEIGLPMEWVVSLNRTRISLP